MTTTSTATALPTDDTVAALLDEGLRACGVDAAVLAPDSTSGQTLTARSPITGQVLATIAADSPQTAAAKIGQAAAAFATWRDVPAPVRGRLVSRWGQLLAEHKEELAKIVRVLRKVDPSAPHDVLLVLDDLHWADP